MPGISFSIPTAKIQRVFFDVEDMAFCVVEESRFEKIPYARCLAVETVWLFERKGSSIYGRVYYRVRLRLYHTKCAEVDPELLQRAHARGGAHRHVRPLDLGGQRGHASCSTQKLRRISAGVQTGVRSARMVDTPREAPPPSRGGRPDERPTTTSSRRPSGGSRGFDAVSADQVSLKTVVRREHGRGGRSEVTLKMFIWSVNAPFRSAAGCAALM